MQRLAKARGTLLAGIGGVALAVLAAPATGEIFHSKESALALAFPDADAVEARDLVLSAADAERVRELSGVKLESRLVTVYEGRRDGQLLGRAFLDTHRVRTLPETILVVLDPAGRVAATHLLAFHEPPEYGAAPRWLAQFGGRSLGPDLALGRGIAGIAGSTLTARAITATVRRVLAVHAVKVAPDETPLATAGPGSPPPPVRASGAPAGS